MRMCVCACVENYIESHVSHLDNVSEEELNRLLSMVVDVENLFTCVHKEEDVDTKQVYFYLFRVRKCTVTTCLENLEMSGNLKHVREMSGMLLAVRELSGKKILSWKSVPKLFISR